MTLLKLIYHVKAIFVKLFYKLIFGSKVNFGKGMTFRNRFNLTVEKKSQIKIGDRVFFNNDCSVNCLNRVEIRNDCIFGESVKIYDHDHVFSNNSKNISEQGFKAAPIIIGNNCWFGSNVVILKGVTIGDNCVIGANSVLTKDVKDNSVVVGNNKNIGKTNYSLKGNK